MDKPAEKRQSAWQPLTPRGVAVFASAPLSRLYLVQLIFASVAAICVVWFGHHAWVPTISQAIGQLPAQSEIRHAKLNWAGPTPASLAENRFLSISIDLNHEGHARSPAHVQVELGRATVKILSLLGFVEVPYPTGWRIGLGRAEAEPWWGAWMPPLLALSGILTIISLLMIWAMLGVLYLFPGWLLAFFANRNLAFKGIWRLAGAALLPGSLFLSGGIVVYGLGALDLPLVGLAAAAHLLIGWIYLATAIWCLPVQAEGATAKANPFAAKP
jgi:hypothetical protein